MGYGQSRGRRPYERASKIAHTEVLNNPVVKEFVEGCALPQPPSSGDLETRLQDLPAGDGRVTSVIAIDGGMTEVPVRKEFPSASIAFMTFGPLLMSLEDLAVVDRQPFIGPEDMVQFNNLQRYTLVIPAKGVRGPGAKGFSEGVRRAIHKFLSEDKPDLLKSLQWLLFREWLPPDQQKAWTIPRCPASPNRECDQGVSFSSKEPAEKDCSGCGRPVFLADSLRLYERIEEEQGARGIMSYLLTTLEQLVLVNVIRLLLKLKPASLREVLLLKDGPLAFFGVTAPLHAPMQELMAYLGNKDGGRPLINLVGLEKSGEFVDHAALIEPRMKSGQLLVLDNEYIYKYILPGDPTTSQAYGKNTYYGTKVVLKGEGRDMYVATIPTGEFKAKPKFADLYNGAEVLKVTRQLRCSMYDNALVPIVLANRLVSLADVPSQDILKKFATRGIRTAAAS